MDAIERLLASGGIRTAAKATDAANALALVQEHQPALVVADFAAGDDPAAALGRIQLVCERSPRTRVIALVGRADRPAIEAALDAGAAAVVVKTADRDDLATAVRQVFAPSLYLADNLERARPPRGGGFAYAGLTSRQVEILHLVADGYRNSEIAKMLCISDQTVKFHLSNIFRKSGAASRAEATVWGRMQGLLGDEDIRGGVAADAAGDRRRGS